MRNNLALLALMALAAPAIAQDAPAGKMTVIDGDAVKRDEPPPHGNIGMSTAYRYSDTVPGRAMEFRKRVLHVGAAIGAHRIEHDEVYYVLSGEGELTAGEEAYDAAPGTWLRMAANERHSVVARTPMVIALYLLPAR